jgi:hypothetical protein
MRVYCVTVECDQPKSYFYTNRRLAERFLRQAKPYASFSVWSARFTVTLAERIAPNPKRRATLGRGRMRSVILCGRID